MPTIVLLPGKLSIMKVKSLMEARDNSGKAIQ